MQEITIRIPTAQYAYLEFKYQGTPLGAIDEHNRLIKAYQDSLKTPEIALNSGLDKISMLRLMYKHLTTNGLTEDDLESLGTDKIYSQQDVVGLIKNVLAKVHREENKHD